MAQSAGTSEYTDCISVERLDSPNECPENDSKQPDGNVPVMLANAEYPFLPSLQGPHWLGLVTPDRLLSMGQIELNYVLILN